jgi:hypothetical protein
MAFTRVPVALLATSILVEVVSRYSPTVRILVEASNVKFG